MLASSPTPPPARLVVEQVLGASVATSVRGQGPLRLLTPKNHGRGAWVFQSSLGGGFIGQDVVALDVTVEDGATCFLSSQAAGKVFGGAKSAFSLGVTVGRGATLVHWPDPTMVYAGASLRQRQRFELAADASLLVVDSWTAGRLALGESWAFDELALKLELSRTGTPLMTDAFFLSSKEGPLAPRMGGVGAFATVAITGPVFADAIAAVERRLDARPLTRLPEPLAVASRWPWGLVLRLGAPSLESLNAVLLELLRPEVVTALGDDPFTRKW